MPHLIRKGLRKLGFKVHKGWKSIHRYGCEIECIGCGERRSLMMGWITPPVDDWWETSGDGDGSCGDIKELPRRFEAN